ncbi:MAG TPA: four helix bundle protein [Vicinamibacterales bacterium]|nr:four helix bundle protein [Vicinamibacterales bacterium]
MISFGTKTALHSTMRAQFTFRDLEVWKQAMDLVERRASTSIPTNLAEGHGRRTTRAYLNHVSIAIGILPPDVADSLLESAQSVGRLLYGLYRALDRRVSALSADP